MRWWQMPANSQAQVAQERPAAFVHQRAQAGDESGAVVQYSDGGMLCAVGIRVVRQVHGPHGVDGHRAWKLAAHVPAQCSQGMLVGVQAMGYKAFAHGGSVVGVQSVEGVGDLAAARMAHQHFEAQYFLGYPVRLAAGGMVNSWYARERRLARKAARLRENRLPSTPPHEANRRQAQQTHH